MVDMIVKIMVELLSVFALATKQITQGRISKYLVTYRTSVAQLCYREVCEEAVRRKRDRGSAPEVRPIDSERGSDRCCSDDGRGPRSCG